MDVRILACVAAAGFITAVMVSAATSLPAYAKPIPNSPVVVTGERIDPSLQREVSYRDLNLVLPAAQMILRGRISRTAASLCLDINDGYDPGNECRNFAVRGTKPQVAAAIERAKLRMAGRAVGPDIAISMAIMGQ